MSTVILVHGAWCDGSSWSDVVPLLQDGGHDVTAVQLPLSSLADDVATVRRAVAAAGDPAVLVGHSYGGAVITEAAAGSSGVSALVYVAAYAPDEGESVLAIGERFPGTEGGATIRATDDGWLTLVRESFPRVFAADVPEPRARVLAAVQAPTHGACFGTPLGAPAWRTLPSAYVRAANDHMVHPDAQASMAERMGATLTSVDSSHAIPLSRPDAVAAAVRQVAAG